MRYMLEADISVLRRRLTGPGALLDFAILEDLAGEGYTDYLVMATELFATLDLFRRPPRRGMFVTWASDRPGGFIDDDLAALQRIQRRLAIACKTVIQSRISRNIAEAYLGRQTGERVLAGSIRLGDGEQTRALVWYSDLRNSTRLAETMPSARFPRSPQRLFRMLGAAGHRRRRRSARLRRRCGAGDFSGRRTTPSCPASPARVTGRCNKSLALTDEINAERVAAGLEPIRYGIGLNVGTVMYGNIGVPERLAFSAIGPTVIEVARIEKLTKRSARACLPRARSRRSSRNSGARWASIASRASASRRSSSGSRRRRRRGKAA